MSSDIQVSQTDDQAPALRSIRPLLYAGERWRFWPAAVVSAGFLLLVVYLLGRSGAPTLIGGGIFLLLTVGSVWWALQLMRARLLGNSVKVTSASFPEVHALLEDVLARLE